MRWPWTREPAAEATPDVKEPAPVATPADPAPSPMGWAFLPPIQRALDTPIEPVTRPASFPAELPAWRSPSFTGTLSHAIVDTVPGGVIDGDGAGLGTPSHTTGPAPELTLLPPPRPTPVQRSVVAEPARVARPAPPGPVVPMASAPISAVAPTAADQPDVVRPEAPAAELTRAPSVGMPVVHRSVVADAPPATPAEVPALADDHAEPPTVEPAPDQPDLPDRPALGATSHATALPAVVQRSVAPTAEPPKPTAGPRLGLGAPLGRAPETAVPVPPTAAPDGAAIPAPPASLGEIADAGFTEVPIQRSLAAPAAPVAPATPAPAAPTKALVQPPVELPAPALTLARSVDPGGPPPQTASPPVPADDPDPPAPPQTDAADQPVAVPDDEPTPAPAVGATERTEVTDVAEPVAADPPAALEPPTLLPSAPLPLTGGLATSIQRADVLPGAGTPTPSLTVRPAPLVPVQRSRERVVPIQREQSETFAPVESAYLTPTPTPSRREVRRADSAGAPQPVAVQRSPAPDQPATDAPSQPAAVTGTGRPAGDVPDASPAPVTLEASLGRGPVVSRAVELVAPAAVKARSSRPTALAAAPAPQQTALSLAAPALAHTESVTVQATAEEVAAPSEAAAPGPPADAAPTSTTGSPGSGPVTVQTAAAAPAAAGAAGVGASATGDVDALAQKLFPAMLRRMKAELLLDRERRGVRTDPW